MEFKIECPWCNQHYSVDESFIDQTVECSVCEKEFTVRKPKELITSVSDKKTDYFLDYFSKQKETNEKNASHGIKPKDIFDLQNKNVRKAFFVFAALILFLFSLSAILYSIVLVKEHKTESHLREGTKAFDEHRFEDAVRLLQYPASQGISEAQFLLGMCYYNGDGIKQDDYEAIKWIRKAAEQGNSEAQLKIGACYLEGKGVNQRDDEALYWLQKSGEQGNSEAQIKLGDYYYDKGEVTAFSEALKWYQKAGKRGEKDRKEKMDNCNVFVKAINGDTEAQIAVFLAYTGGLYGVKEDLDEAKKWLIKAADSGSPEAQGLLGALYYKADNTKEAVKWLGKAAEQGKVTAQYQLGALYLVEKDYKEAIKWLRKAAEQDHADAQFALGLCLYQHYGEASRAESMIWIRKAANGGSNDAKDLLKKLSY